MSGKNATERQRADERGISRAAQILRSGGLVAVPTETVYGLAARADDAEAVARIYRAKGRPGFNPLIVHVASLDQAVELAQFGSRARELAEIAWPGALTLVLPVRPEAAIAPAVTAGLDTLAIRVPAHPVMQAVLRETGVPLAAPSANRSNFISPTTADHVAASLDGRIDMILDGGACTQGLESTIVAVRHDGTIEVLRPGPVDPYTLPDGGIATAPDPGKRIEAPGQLPSHYSPGKPVRLDATAPREGEFMIGFGPIGGAVNLSPSGELAEAAAQLYSALHAGAQATAPVIAVAPIPAEGIGIAINDRLRRAAA